MLPLVEELVQSESRDNKKKPIGKPFLFLFFFSDCHYILRLDLVLKLCWTGWGSWSPHRKPGIGAWASQRGAGRSRSVRPGRSKWDRPAAHYRRHTGNTEGANSCRARLDWQTQLCLHRRSVCHTGKIHLVGWVEVWCRGKEVRWYIL